MKRTILLLLVLSLSVLTFSQTDTLQIKTVFKHKKGNTFIVAQKFQFTEFDGNPTFMIGAGGGKIFNHKFLLGGGGYGTMKGLPVKAKNYEPLNLDANISHSLHFGYGGFWTGYMYKWQNRIHLMSSVMWAMGAVSVKENSADQTVAMNLVYILQPMIELEINLTDFTRIGIAPEYRFVGNVQLEGYNSLDFSGFGAVFFIKFGAF